MKIQNYLHLYFGFICDVTWTQEGLENGFQNGINQIDGILLDNMNEIESGKIHLRPLSDITDDERLDWEAKTFIGTDGVHIVGIRQETPDSIAYKLSRGFDLFHLFETGLAY
jgi:hypothetical protein